MTVRDFINNIGLQNHRCISCVFDNNDKEWYFGPASYIIEELGSKEIINDNDIINNINQGRVRSIMFVLKGE